MGLVVGFDLDMTLVDSHEGIVDAIRKVLREYGHETTDEEIFQTVGIPLALVWPKYLPEPEGDRATRRYREIYSVEGIPTTKLLPGARESLEAIRAANGEVLVISAKLDTAVKAVLDVVGLQADHIVGSLYAEAKGDALKKFDADIYVGDHVGDVKGAKAAGCVAVAVNTGPSTREELEQAGADVLLVSLEEFPAWLASYLAK